MADLKSRFPWGLIIEDVTLGPYTVRSYHPAKYDQNGYGTGDNDTDAIHYHGYIDGKDCNEGWLTLDEALVGMIVRRIAGPNNRQISRHFMAGLNAMKVTT